MLENPIEFRGKAAFEIAAMDRHCSLHPGAQVKTQGEFHKGGCPHAAAWEVRPTVHEWPLQNSYQQLTSSRCAVDTVIAGVIR
jgi:hypothetical protein